MSTEATAPSADQFIANATDPYDVDDRPQAAPTSLVASGWEAADALSPQVSEGFPNEMRLSETAQIIRFIDQNGPFATFKQHWLDKPGKKSYVCLNSKPGNDCPLCSVLGDTSRDKRAFTVINFSAEGGPEKQVLMAPSRLYKSLHLAHFSPQGPLTKNYWAISRSGKMATTVYNLQAIKPRDLQEDWNIDGDNAETVVSAATSFAPTLYRENSYAELLEVAEEMKGSN